MQEMLAIFLTWQFILLCIALSCATFIFRKLVDFFILENPKIPVGKHSRVWRDLVLPFTPIFLGMAFGASPASNTFPFPEALSEWTSRFLFCACAGMLSPLVYRVITALLRTNVQLPDNVNEMLNKIPSQPINIASPNNLNIVGGTIQDANPGIPLVVSAGVHPNAVSEPEVKAHEPEPIPQSGGTTIIVPANANIIGPKGDEGDIGPQGIPGAVGPAGEKGEKGEKGEDGEY